MTVNIGGYENVSGTSSTGLLNATFSVYQNRAALDVATLPGYMTSDTDDANDPKYYGFLHADGKWYIQQWMVASGTFRYAKGGSQFSTNWGNRSGLSYDYWDVVF